MKKGDILLLVSIVVVCVLFIVAFAIIKPSGNTVIIKQNNAVYGEYPLNTDKKIELEHNTVVIQNGEAYVSFADCPDKVCFKHKPIKMSGDTIICLPNKVIVEIQ